MLFRCPRVTYETYWNKLHEAGGQSVAFRAHLVLSTGVLIHRNYRKIAVIDGDIGYVGGFNVGDEY